MSSLKKASYRIVASCELPHIHPTRTVLETYGSPRIIRFLQRWFLTYRTHWLGIYGLNMLPYMSFPFTPIAIEHAYCWTSLISLSWIVINIAEARVDLVKLLMQMYEFWFLQVSNVLLGVCLAGFLRDWRIIRAFCTWFTVCVAPILDAIQYKSFREVLVPIGTVIGASPLIAALVFDMVEQPHDFQLLAFAQHALMAREALVNCMATISIFALRTTFLFYRSYSQKSKRVAPKTTPTASPAPGAEARTSSVRTTEALAEVIRIRSISFHCRVRLQLIEPPAHGTANLKLTKAATMSARVQMHLVDDGKIYDASHVVFGWMLRWCTTRWFRTTLSWLSKISWITTIVAFPLVQYYKTTAPLACTLVSVVSLGSAVACMILCVGLYQRTLMKRLCWTFDAVFLSVQFTIAHLCVCDMFCWDLGVTCAILSSWLWIHWVITLDALTPVLRQALHLETTWRIWIILFSIVAQVLLALELLVWQQWNLRDRTVAELYLSHEYKTSFAASSTLFGRSVTLIPWCCRLLWRHWFRLTDDELLIIKGSTEYDATLPELTLMLPPTLLLRSPRTLSSIRQTPAIVTPKKIVASAALLPSITPHTPSLPSSVPSHPSEHSLY